MSDLISRSELIEKLWQKHKEIDDKCYCYTNADESKEIICGIVSMIDEQPTAYSVENVVTELKERKALHERLVDYETKNGTVTEKYQHIKAIDVLDDAIEIVKQGGLSDDVCEWKLTDTKKLMPYKTSCGNEDLYDNSYKYCPYCGKKIRWCDR